MLTPEEERKPFCTQEERKAVIEKPWGDIACNVYKRLHEDKINKNVTGWKVAPMTKKQKDYLMQHGMPERLSKIIDLGSLFLHNVKFRRNVVMR